MNKNFTPTGEVKAKRAAMLPPSLCSNEFGRICYGGHIQKHRHLIVFNFAYVTFTALCHVVYFSEMRDSKNAMRERVKAYFKSW
jgi:hypothetical protein